MPQGAAMGSPLSPIVANIFMEEFETSTLQQATHQPKLWLRYDDNTFIIWPHSKQQLDNFFQHLNNQHSNIRFTMETEAQGSLPFLDVHITKATDGHLTHQVYRKTRHTDRYLHYRSFQHTHQMGTRPQRQATPSTRTSTHQVLTHHHQRIP